jgi:peptidoglycan/LPS O-acetylase OafA/YrhL
MIKSLEGVRGIAALMVALYHLQLGSIYSGAVPVLRQGYLFVDVFFVLSGFVMCAAYAGKLATADDLWSFLIRRTGRLLPLLIYSTVIFVLLADGIVLAKKLAVAHGYGSYLNNPGALQYMTFTGKELLATVTMTHSLGIFDHLILNTPSWSISTEFYTYIIFAGTCLLLAGRNRLAAFGIISMAAFLVSIWASVNVHGCVAAGHSCLALTYDLGLLRCMASFFLGALVFYFSRRVSVKPATLQWISCAGLLGLFVLVDTAPAAAFAIPPAFALVILALSQDTGPFANPLKVTFFQMLGQRSYSIYLMHMPLLLIFENFSKRANSVWSMIAIAIAYVITLVVVSGWTYRLIENPFRLRFYMLADSFGKRVASGPVKTQ